ncbi:MAG TPA: ferredoxin Fer [Halococcus sp.]|nr:ferredoxin Fer [Halococcus sp.]
MGIELPAVRPEAEKEAEELPPSKVKYLNYRAIESHGWDVDDEDLFEKAAEADLDELDYGVMEADRTESLLRSAEQHGLKWPFQCRSSTCATCAGIVKEGEAEMDMNLFLEDEEVEEMDLRLTCTCLPKSDEVHIVFNGIQMPYIRDISLNRG